MTIRIETVYDKRPEGYDRLGSYAGGSNMKEMKLPFYSPTLMKVNDNSNGERKKVMTWPMLYSTPGSEPPKIENLPEPTIGRVNIIEVSSIVVAVQRFEMPATEVVARGLTRNLLNDIKRDKLVPAASALGGECIVGQFDALFSLNKRRNEVWVELESHLW